MTALIGAIGQIHSTMSEVRANFDMVDSVRKVGPVKKNLGSLRSVVETVFTAAKAPVEHTRLLGFTGWFGGGLKIAKECKKPTTDKISRSLNIMGGIRTLTSATASFGKGIAAVRLADCVSNPYLQTTLKVMATVATPLSQISALLSGVLFFTKTYEFYQHRKFMRNWVQINGEKDNRAVAEMLNKMSPEEFKKVFRFEKSKIQKELEEFSKPIPKQQRKYSSAKVKVETRRTFLKVMGEKLKVTKKYLYSDMGSAALMTFGNWLGLAQVAPAASIALKNISGAWLALSKLSQINFKAYLAIPPKKAAEAARDYRKAREFQKTYHELYREWKYGRDLQSFKLKDKSFAELVKLVRKSSPDTIQIVFGIKKERLAEGLHDRYVNCHEDKEIDRLFQVLERRIQGQIRFRVTSVALSVSAVVSCVCLFIPVTQPFGCILLSVSLAGAAYTLKRAHKSAKGFEKSLGIPATLPTPLVKMETNKKRPLASRVENYDRLRTRYI